MTRYQLFIDNAWVDPHSARWFDSHDPFSGEAWAEIPRGDAVDAERAVSAAAAAFIGPWSRLAPSERGTLLYKLGSLIERDAQHLAEIESRDNGKLRTDVLAQVRYMAKYFYYYAGLADKIHGVVVPIDKPRVFNYVRYEPMGVVVCITPWNSSLSLSAWKIAPALCAGNTVVCKPSEYTSASLLEFSKLVVEAGLPPGVFNVVTGIGAEIGELLVRHPAVQRIAFTGGDEAGRRIYAMAAEGLKRVSLELGGKSPNIVFDDADFDQAVHGALSGVFSASGQTCVAGSRLLLQESIHDAFVERIASLTNAAVVGDPADPKTQIGPITTRPQFDKVMRYIEIARQDGARCVAGGQALSGPGYGAGQLVQPTIFVDVTNAMRIAQEEVFGPVLSVLKFRDEEDAIRIANDIRFGLAAGVWTQSLHRAMLMSERLRAGTIWINNYRSSSYTTPFGGFKDSGIGREGGIDAVREYMEPKSVWISSDLPMANPFARK
ncbi:MAG: aldehyde dehydrogenase [Burkholderiales bacterium]|nr:aldehyde dehydrogenase [Burkholderiales bacterium]